MISVFLQECTWLRDLTSCHLWPVTDHPVISARVGTLKRKQQVRQFLENMPREDVDDVFSSAYMQNKRFEVCPCILFLWPPQKFCDFDITRWVMSLPLVSNLMCRSPPCVRARNRTSCCQTWSPWPPRRPLSPKSRRLSVCISLRAWWAPPTGECSSRLSSSLLELTAVHLLTYLLLVFVGAMTRSTCINSRRG